MRFQPIHDRILIKPTPPDNHRAGLEMLQSEVEPKSEGTVVAVGHGVPLHNIHLNLTGDADDATMIALKEVVSMIEQGRKMRVKVGDYVMYGKYAGTKIIHEGEEHIMIREADVFGILTDD